MGWLGLEWGNVPSWISTGGLVIAAAVYVRDRNHRLKFQAQAVGVWATANIVWQEGCAYARVEICAHNASDLPASIRYVWYRVGYMVTRVGASYGAERSQEPDSALKETPVTVPPKSTVTLISGVMNKLKEESVDTFGITNMNVVVKRFEVIDNSGIVWSIHPMAGRSSRRVRRFTTLEQDD